MAVCTLSLYHIKFLDMGHTISFFRCEALEKLLTDRSNLKEFHPDSSHPDNLAIYYHCDFLTRFKVRMAMKHTPKDNALSFLTEDPLILQNLLFVLVAIIRFDYKLLHPITTSLRVTASCTL